LIVKQVENKLVHPTTAVNYVEIVSEVKILNGFGMKLDVLWVFFRPFLSVRYRVFVIVIPVIACVIVVHATGAFATATITASTENFSKYGFFCYGSHFGLDIGVVSMMSV
jgi:hypothetical protein